VGARFRCLLCEFSLYTPRRIPMADNPQTLPFQPHDLQLASYILDPQLVPAEVLLTLKEDGTMLPVVGRPCPTFPEIFEGIGMAKKGWEALRRAVVRQLFEARPSREHTEAGIFLFHRWLADRYPELLPRGKDDPYEHLKVDLKGLYTVPKMGLCLPRWSKLCS